jgi:hypothetical protein
MPRLERDDLDRGDAVRSAYFGARFPRRAIGALSIEVNPGRR